MFSATVRWRKERWLLVDGGDAQRSRDGGCHRGNGRAGNVDVPESARDGAR